MELLSYSDLEQEIKKRKEKLLSEKINVTDFLIWFIEDYPESFKIMKENPEFQYQFK